MKFTEEHLEAGKSSRGAWSYAQLDMLDVNWRKTGWKKRAFNREYPERVIHEFIAFKDAHLPESQRKPVKIVRAEPETFGEGYILPISKLFVYTGPITPELIAECPFDL